MKPKTLTRIFVTLATTLTVTVAVPSPVHADPTKGFDGLVLPEQFYYRLARCETNNNVNHSTRSYTGMFGIHRQTWKRWSNSSSAKGKTAREQALVVDAIAFLGHTEPNGEYVWPVGVYGWGAVKSNCMNLQRYVCRSKHPKVQKWKRNC